MKYESTRGLEKELSFEDVLFAGFAKDRGLYMPEDVPHLSPDEFRDWATLPYDQLVYQVMRKFISPQEITDEDLRGVIESSFVRFCHPSVIGVKKLLRDLSIFELFHGPTMAFKDLALTVVAALLDLFMKRRKKHLIALVATSGDTGSSALESIRGRKNCDIIVLFPKDRCTKIQQLQMTTIRDENIHLFCGDGTSDDLDLPIKQCFADVEFVSKHNLISLNSINVGRVLAQIPMYIFAYYKLAAHLGEPVEIIVPTGGAGSITAGCLARKMGYPISLASTVNVNDAVAQTLKEGIFSFGGQVHRTFSCAMDIQMAYNMERIFYLFSGRNSDKVKAWMEAAEKEGKSRVSDETLAAMREVITDYHVVTDEEVKNVIRKMKKEFDYFICPHTATGVSYYFSLPTTKRDVPRGAFATASPEKFPEAVAAAGFDAPKERVQHLFGKEEKFTEMTKQDEFLSILKEKITFITNSKTNVNE